MALTFQDYTANGTAVSFAIPFDRIRDVHVKVFYESTEVTTGWSVVGNNVIFSSPPPNGTIVRIRRITDFSERLVDYVDGSRLNEVDLDTDSKQAFYLIQENRDINDVSMVKNSSGNWEADFDRIQSVADPVVNNDAANKLYVDQTASNFASYGFGAPATRWAFTGNGTAVVFSITGATLVTSTYYLVTVNGAVTDPAAYTVTPNTLTFNSAPANASAIVVILLGYPRMSLGGNVGIGTTSPARTLHVNSGTADFVARFESTDSGAEIVLQDDASTNEGNRIGVVGNDFRITTNNTERLRIDSAGSVGIGTSSPANRLHIAKSTATVADTQLELEGGTNGYGAGIDFASRTSSGGSLVSMAKITADGEGIWNTTASTQDAGLRFFTAADGSLNERMRINASGNVGIGTTTAAYPATGRTLLTVNGPTSAVVALQVNNVSGGYLYDDGTTVTVGAPAGRVINFDINGERMRIDASGNVGIGTSGPSAKLEIDQTSNTIGAIRASAAAGQNGNAFLFGIAGVCNGYVIENDGSNNIVHRWHGTGGFERMRIASNGNVGIGTVSPATRLHVDGTIRYTSRPTAGTITAIGFDANGDLRSSSSSLRYKQNVEPYAKGLAEVAQLEPVTFNYNGEELVNAGLIVEAVDELGLEEFVLRDSEGTADAIPYGNMVALLINAIKELKVRVEALEAAQ